MTGNDINDMKNSPFVIDGPGNDVLKINIEAESSKQAYFDLYAESAASEVIDYDNVISNKE